MSGISLLKREEEYTRNRQHEIKNAGITIYYKGIELEKKYIQEDIEMFEYIDIKGELERSHINISRRGFTSNGKKYFEERIYHNLINSVKKVLKYINGCQEKSLVKEQLIKSIKQKIENLSEKEATEKSYNTVLGKLAEQIVTVSFLSYLAVKDVNDEISQLGSRCGRDVPCIWQDIINGISKLLEENKTVRSQLRDYSVLFYVAVCECGKQGEISPISPALTILDVFKHNEHYAILQVRENEYAKWLCYIIRVGKGIYKQYEDAIFGKNRKNLPQIAQWEEKVFKSGHDIANISTVEHKYEQQFVLTWLVKNLPAMAIASDPKGNVRLSILCNYIYPCVYTNENHKLLIMQRVLDTYCEEQIERFSIYAWQERQYLAVKAAPFSCYFIKRGYLNKAALHKVIFPLNGAHLYEIKQILDKADKYDFVKNTKLLADRLDYKAYLAKLTRQYDMRELHEGEESYQLVKKMREQCEKEGKSLTSLIREMLEFFLDFLNSDMQNEDNGNISDDYFERMKVDEEEWYESYIDFASLFLDVNSLNEEEKNKALDRLKDFLNKPIIKTICAGHQFLKKGHWKKFIQPQYSKIVGYKKEFFQKYKHDPTLVESNKRVQKYILDNARYPIRQENLERCFRDFVEEIFGLFEEIEREKVESILVNILKDI